MRRATLFFLTALFASPPLIAAGNSEGFGLFASAPGLIRDKRQVPDDPLAGLPTGTGDDGGHGKSGGKSARLCRIDATAANPRDVGDLRATLAFVRRGLTTWPCPPHLTENGELRLRITVDGGGKITDVEPARGDSGTAKALAKKLVGQTAAPHLDHATVGTTVLRFTSSKNGRPTAALENRQFAI
jgi:hypothetical protein